MRPDLEKLRRFSLTVAIVLFVYGIAGVDIKPNEGVRPLGIPLELKEPTLVGGGLLLAAIYAVARYFYYSSVATESRFRTRRGLRRGLESFIDPMQTGSVTNVMREIDIYIRKNSCM